MTDDLKNLFLKYIDGSISAEEVRALEEHLTTDKALRKEFFEHINVDVAIENHPDFPLYQSPSRVSQFEGNTVSARWWNRMPAWGWAAAACIGIVLAFGLGQFSAGPSGVPGIVLRNDEAVVRGEGLQYSLGDRVAFNEIDLEKGWLRLELPKGVVFDIYGPAKGRFLSAERFELDVGRLNIDVGPAGKGFTVVTENGDIVDLGTQFGVDVGGDRRAKVAVFSGEVEVYSRESEGGPRLLEEGEGLSLDSAITSSRLMSVNVADDQRPNRRLAEDENTFEIRDNLTSEQSLRFYGIVSDGMREGVNAYTTQKVVRWWSDAGEVFPAELSGADLVQTFHHDRDQDDLEIRLDVRRDSVVYVFFDERYSPPEWLPDTLVDTGQTVRSGPWRPSLVVRDIEPDENGEIYVRYRVWRTDVAADESLDLGASFNRNRGKDQTSRVMYGIAVKSH